MRYVYCNDFWAQNKLTISGNKIKGVKVNLSLCEDGDEGEKNRDQKSSGNLNKIVFTKSFFSSVKWSILNFSSDFQCPKCVLKFSLTHNLNRHTKNIHKGCKRAAGNRAAWNAVLLNPILLLFVSLEYTKLHFFALKICMEIKPNNNFSYNTLSPHRRKSIKTFCFNLTYSMGGLPQKMRLAN